MPQRWISPAPYQYYHFPLVPSFTTPFQSLTITSPCSNKPPFPPTRLCYAKDLPGLYISQYQCTNNIILLSTVVQPGVWTGSSFSTSLRVNSNNKGPSRQNRTVTQKKHRQLNKILTCLPSISDLYLYPCLLKS